VVPSRDLRCSRLATAACSWVVLARLEAGEKANASGLRVLRSTGWERRRRLPPLGLARATGLPMDPVVLLQRNLQEGLLVRSADHL